MLFIEKQITLWIKNTPVPIIKPYTQQTPVWKTSSMRWVTTATQRGFSAKGSIQMLHLDMILPAQWDFNLLFSLKSPQRGNWPPNPHSSWCREVFVKGVERWEKMLLGPSRAVSLCWWRRMFWSIMFPGRLQRSILTIWGRIARKN